MNMFSNKTGGKPGAKKPVIRRETVQVPVKQISDRLQPASATSSPASTPSARPRDPSRFKLTQRSAVKSVSPAATPALQRPPKTVEKRALASSRGLKRKQSATPQPVFSDEEDDDSSEIGASDSDASRKRIKSSVSSVSSLAGPRRHVICRDAFGAEEQSLDYIHGADATSGDSAAKFSNPWDTEVTRVVELRYPSKSKAERFELKWPKNESDDYKPMEDIAETIKKIALYYFPESLSDKCMDDITGYERRFNRAWQHQSVTEFVEIVEEFNDTLSSLIQDGTIEKELSSQTQLHLQWVQRILDQIYSRTVSPKVESLRAYTNGSDNVYGELFPRFISDIFKQTQMNHEHVFIDLGSGVGNVVLQAALEIGCESWGVEMMKNPCELAALQAKEFAARARLWGLQAGTVRLLDGDMTSHEEVPKVLRRADVVLVNNQAFTPQLNDALLSMFLELREGAQVVSLKPFVPEGHKMAMRNIDSLVNQFVQRKFEYFSDSVSWSHYGNGHWYVATKDSRPLNQYRAKMGIKS